MVKQGSQLQSRYTLKSFGNQYTSGNFHEHYYNESKYRFYNQTLPGMNFHNIARRGFSSGANRIDLYYDVVSPYAWLGFEVFQRYSSRWGIQMNLKPFFLSGIMQGSGNKPPGMNPAKGKYLYMDAMRTAKHFDVPLTVINFQEMLSKTSLQPMRFLKALQMYHPEYLPEMSRQLFRMRFHEDKDSTTPEGMKEAAKKSGMSEEEINSIFEKMSTKEVKDSLKAATEEALKYGAFGAPFFVATVNGENKIFFGSDRFAIIASEVGEKYEGPNPGVSSKL